MSTITVNRSDLALALKAAGQVMANKPPVPVLANVRCNVVDGWFYLDAVGMQGFSSQSRFKAFMDAGAEYQFLLNAGMLRNALPRLPEAVEMRVLKNKIQFSLEIGEGGGGRKMVLMTADYEAFPPLPDPANADDWVFIDTADLVETARGLLRGTDEEAHTDKPWQNVAHFTTAGPEFVAISSDGKRICTVDGACSSTPGTVIDVPLKMLRSILALAGYRYELETASIGQDPHRTWVRLGGSLRMCFPRLHVEFPDIGKAILAKLRFDDKARVISEDLRGEIETCAGFGRNRAADDRFGHGFRLEANPHSIVVATEVKDRGEYEGEVIHGSTLSAFTTGYNYDYVLPVLAECEGEIEVAFAKQGLNNFPLRITDEQGAVRSSWIIQSLNIYPGSGLPGAEAARPAPARDAGLLTPLDKRILDAYALHGPLTPDQVAEKIGDDKLNTRPRCTELKKAGWLRETGDRRETESGGTSAVLEAV